MALHDIVTMAGSGSLMQRIAACAAGQGIEPPYGWASDHIWGIVSSSEWEAAWAYAEDAKTVNVNPDTGARIDVINDGMILSAVQAAIAEDQP